MKEYVWVKEKKKKEKSIVLYKTHRTTIHRRKKDRKYTVEAAAEGRLFPKPLVMQTANHLNSDIY